MNYKLMLNELETFIGVRIQLQGQYQQQFDGKDREISQLSDVKAALKTKVAELEKNWGYKLPK